MNSRRPSLRNTLIGIAAGSIIAGALWVAVSALRAKHRLEAELQVLGAPSGCIKTASSFHLADLDTNSYIFVKYSCRGTLEAVFKSIAITLQHQNYAPNSRGSEMGNVEASYGNYYVAGQGAIVSSDHFLASYAFYEVPYQVAPPPFDGHLSPDDNIAEVDLTLE